jgi:hypothetical protein
MVRHKNVANPKYDHECMRHATDHAITIARITSPRSPTATVIILSRWEHTLY